MEKVTLDYTYYEPPSGYEGLLEDFLKQKRELPFVKTLNEPWMERIEKKLQGFNPRHIALVGIGGSSLGTEAVLRALLPASANSRGRRFFVFDNVDPERTLELAELLEPSETAFVVVSKSGNTTETLANFSLLYSRFPRKENFIVVTSGGRLKEMAESEGFLIFSVPQYLPGRYSVLSPVGLVPLYLSGVNVEALLQGALEGIKLSSQPYLKNPALLSAAAIYQEWERGRNINVVLSYSEHLYFIGFWYRQLFSESLGKAGWGPTPVLDLGSVDQHSKLQLYLDGPDDKVYTFWRVREFRKDVVVPELDELKAGLFGREMSWIYTAMALSTEMALAESGRPTLAFELPRINERFLGQFLAVLQVQVWFISRLAEVNPFDQPGVERMKRLAKEMILGKRKAGERRTT